jgi:hypothetical protein
MHSRKMTQIMRNTQLVANENGEIKIRLASKELQVNYKAEGEEDGVLGERAAAGSWRYLQNW